MKNQNLEQVYITNQINNIISDKGTVHSYIEVYSDLFKNQTENIDLLEIGVNDGDSMKLWSNYFFNSNIIGIDIDLRKLKYPQNGFKAYQADGTNKEQLDFLLGSQKFDIIIDDGSHILEHQLKSFEILFDRLKDDGIYIIEDIQNPNQDLHYFEKLSNNVEILDLRNKKNRYDDVLVLIRK